MKFEIISGGHTEVIELPGETDFVGIKVVQSGHSFDIFSINFDLPDELCGGRVECHTEQRELDGGMTVTLYCYSLSGAAKALSLKGYDGLVFFDVTYGDIRFILTV